MRYLVSTLLLAASLPLLSQDGCDLLNIQNLAADNLSQQAEIEALSCYAGVEMDGYRYYGVPIGDQCWFAENLRTTVYADGSAIAEVTDDTIWAGLNTGARCVYGNDSDSNYEYGLLYNWHAVDHASGLCPSGWHVPTDEEWTDLETYITSQGFDGTEGTALKTTSGWKNGGGGTDDFGFSALPGGLRYANGNGFNNAEKLSYWWSSTSLGASSWRRGLGYTVSTIYRYGANPRFGFSVRCLRDAD